MRRIAVSAFVLSALCGSASAGPYRLPYIPYSEPVSLAQPPDLNPLPSPAETQHYGAQQPQQPQQRYAQSAQPNYAEAPGSAGAVPARSAASSYAATAPSGNLPPERANGGGFLAAIFGGSAGQSHLFQPALPDYQSAPQSPSGAVNQASYAPSSQGDMASYQADPKYDRQVVDYNGEEKPGTIVIDTPNKFLYLVQDGGKALRYGIGVGRPGFTWSGVKTVSAMKEWPDWRPPADMLERRPDLPRYMPGGVDNPLGARALYLGSTLYRIHGSNEPWTIGTNVSSGCIRMRNGDVTDLYGRVKVGTKVVVI